MLVCCLGCLCSARVLASETPGYSYIELKADPGHKVFLDDTFYGLTNREDGGLILETSPGGHRIRVERPGFQPQLFSVSLEPNQVLVLSVKAFIPEIKIQESGTKDTTTLQRETGTLVLQTLPLGCRIRFLELGIDAVKKEDIWSASPVPTGTHSGTIENNGQSMPLEVNITKDWITHLFVNLRSGTIREIYVGPDSTRVKKERKRKIPAPPPSLKDGPQTGPNKHVTSPGTMAPKQPKEPSARFDKDRGIVVFRGISANHKELLVYSLSGDLVWKKDLNDEADACEWSLENLDGQKVAPGVYFFALRVADGKDFFGKIVIQ